MFPAISAGIPPRVPPMNSPQSYHLIPSGILLRKSLGIALIEKLLEFLKEILEGYHQGLLQGFLQKYLQKFFQLSYSSSGFLQQFLLSFQQKFFQGFHKLQTILQGSLHGFLQKFLQALIQKFFKISSEFWASGISKLHYRTVNTLKSGFCVTKHISDKYTDQ